MRRQLRQLAARVESAREEERARISREVYDEFGQMLSVLKLDFETLAFRHRPRGAEARSEFDKRVAAIVRGIDLSMKTVRRIAAEILLAFALSYPDEPALRIDIADLQGHDFGDAQAGSVGGHQRGPIANGRDMLEELGYFGRAEDYRQFVWYAASRESILRPGRLQSHVVEEFCGHHEMIDGLCRVLALVNQIQLVFAKFFQAQVFGTGLIESRQAGNVVQVRSLRFRAEIAQLHIFDHALTKRCHATAPWILDWSLGNNRIHCFKEPRATPGGCPVADDYREAV